MKNNMVAVSSLDSRNYLAVLRSLFFLFVILSLFAKDVFASDKASDKASEVVIAGAPAPRFSLLSAEGDEINLEDYLGKPVILEWTNHECPYVQKHYNGGNMQRIQRKLTEEGAVWLSIISSAPGNQGYVSASEAQNIAARKGSYASKILFDPAGTVGRLYKARTTPQMVMIDAAGKLRYYGAIDDQPSVNPQSLKGANTYILDAWDALVENKPINPSFTTPYGCSIKY